METPIDFLPKICYNVFIDTYWRYLKLLHTSNIKGEEK